jgi:hypothetical protein
MKITNKYHLRLEQRKRMKIAQPLEIEFENHDEIFQIINLVKEKKLFKDDNHSTEFALGL